VDGWVDDFVYRADCGLLFLVLGSSKLIEGGFPSRGVRTREACLTLLDRTVAGDRCVVDEGMYPFRTAVGGGRLEGVAANVWTKCALRDLSREVRAKEEVPPLAPAGFLARTMPPGPMLPASLTRPVRPLQLILIDYGNPALRTTLRLLGYGF